MHCPVRRAWRDVRVVVMSKLLLWVCVGLGGLLGSLIPLLWGSNDLLMMVIFSTAGSLLGIWVWYRWLRFT